MSAGNFRSRKGKIGHVGYADEVGLATKSNSKKSHSILPIEAGLKDIDLKAVGAEGEEMKNAGLSFVTNVAQTNKDKRTSGKVKGGTDFNFTNQDGSKSFLLDEITKHIADGSFESVVETISNPKFVKESYEKADAKGKADIKVLAAVALASHGEEISEGLRRNDGMKDIKSIPEHHIADVVKMSMEFGASQKSMNAIVNILHEAGKLPAVLEHLFQNAKSSDLINLTSSIVKLGLDPSPITCAQTAFRLMSYALDHAGIQKNNQPTLFKFVSTLARGFQLGSNIMEAAGNVAGLGMLAGVSNFLVHRIADYAMRQKVRNDHESMRFADQIEQMQKDYESQTPKQREDNFNTKEEERSATRQRVREALIVVSQSNKVEEEKENVR